MTIWKITIPVQSIGSTLLPVGSKPIRVAEQHGEMQLWFTVPDTRATLDDITYIILGTGQIMPEEYVETMTYVGSAELGIFVWRLYLENRYTK